MFLWHLYNVLSPTGKGVAKIKIIVKFAVATCPQKFVPESIEKVTIANSKERLPVILLVDALTSIHYR